MDDVLWLSRLQFALTIIFHYIYPPLSIGLGLMLVIYEGLWLKTREAIYHQIAKFFTRIFALTFALGVATGIVMEFEFGTNWATYSRYVGDIFGSALAAEGIFAFFLESGFLALLLFGWGRIGPKLHFFATCMVALGAHFSAVWIIVANSWMQTPAGFHIVGEGMKARAEITNFWEMVLNPSSVDRLTHTIGGCWAAGAAVVISISAWYMLKGKHAEFSRKTMKAALVVMMGSLLFQCFTGHNSAIGVAKNQPAKLAAFEGHWETGPNAPLYLFGWVDDKNETTYGVKIPGMLSYLTHGNPDAPVTGLDKFAKEDRPPVNFTFQTYHLMIALGMMMLGVYGLACLAAWRGWLAKSRWLQWILVVSVLAPQVANQVGWWTAEVGRQPWIVYGVLRTSEALSESVKANQVLFSLILFSVVYALLFAMFIYLFNEKIQKGPDDEDLTPHGKTGLPHLGSTVVADGPADTANGEKTSTSEKDA